MEKMNTWLSFLLAGALLALVICPTSALFGDDRNMFSASTKPNVMLLLDISSTMFNNKDFEVASADLNTFQNYTTSTGQVFTFTEPSYMKVNKKWGYYTTRTQALKRATIQILDAFRDKVKLGLSYFFFPPNVNYKTRKGSGTTQKPYYLANATYDAAEYGDDGAIIRCGITDLSTSTSTTIDAAHDNALDAMCTIVNDLREDGTGSTPIAESMDTIYGYFKADSSGNSLISDTTKFPNTWTDRDDNPRIPTGSKPPKQFSCQQNYIIIVTDGQPTNDAPYHYTRSDPTSANDNDPNGDYVWDYSTITNYSVVKCHDYSHPYTKASPEPVNPMVFDGYNWDNVTENSSTDVQKMAKFLYDHPLYSPQEDGQPNGNIITWAIGMKLTGTAATRLQTAAANGHGLYKSADDFDQLNDSLIDALNVAYYGTFAYAGYTSPKKITTSDENKYVSYTGFFLNHDAPIWEGHLQCLAITPKTNSYEFVELWDAADRMYNQFKGTGWQNRKITTRKTTDGTPNFLPVNFSDTPANRSALQAPLLASSTDEAGTIIRYILGDMSATGRNITQTSSQFLLADIFHSDTTYVGKPFAWKSVYDVKTECPNSSDASDTDCYKKFYNDYVNRTKVLYAGTNDGIIHQINASTATSTSEGGTELRGFIPSQLLPKLKKIAIDKQYTYTADGRMTAADIYSTTNKWQTILAYGFRDGAKGIGCFNVSNPENVSLKWNFPPPAEALTVNNVDNGNHTGLCDGFPGNGGIHFNNTVASSFQNGQMICTPDGSYCTKILCIQNKFIVVENTTGFQSGMQLMLFPSIADYVGYVWCKPVIGRMKYKKGSTGTETQAWVIIITGGRSDNVSGNEGKSLFILDADTGAPIWYLAHKSGTSDDNTEDYYKSILPALDYTVPQSLTAVDLDNDTFIDTIYFGNNGGHLFKLDVSNPVPTTWIPKHMFADISSKPKPIYLSPAVAYDQCYKLWLYFGSGDRNKPQECDAGQFVAMRDEYYASADPYPLTATSTILQKLSWSHVAGTAYTASTTTDSTKKGWYFDFIDTSEILFDPDPFIVPDNSVPHLFFNTYERTIPPVAGDPCSTGGNMHVYDITLPSCSNNNSFLLTGLRDLGRIAGHGLFGSDSDLVYINDSKLGDTKTKKFKESNLEYPGGVIYFKEITR